jgi:filamentous hemagglutinin family protein
MIDQSWLSRCWQWQIGGCVAIFGAFWVGGGDRVNAQIVPDNTLGAESSVVTPNVNIRGIPGDKIDGGAIRGANLFHSFSQFNIGEGRGAYFTNPAGILNILTRVTGAERSNILGRLGVNGNANLFLINPNGIVFGPNASLDVQGSFLATTANGVKLGDAGLFSATQPTTSNLLSVSPSALWFNAVAAQPIVNRSQAPSLINQPNLDDGSPGLQVQPGRTLALIGGDVLLEGGRLTAAGGRIELGSVAGVGEVNLSQSGNNFVLGYDSINNFGNISLSNGAFVDASGEGGGDVQIRGAQLEMTQGSAIFANTLGAENGGEVLVFAAEVILSESSFLIAGVAPTGTGTGGDLRIDTRRLLVQGGAQVSANTRGAGKGGRLQITAAESVEVIGTSADSPFPSGLFAASQGSGNAGDLTIDTRRLLVQGGATVSTGTRGSGKGGSLQISASDAVEVIGTSADGNILSALGNQSRGSGDAGNLTINTGRLLVRDGAQVGTGTVGEGKGGNLRITADFIELIGSTADGEFSSGLFSQSDRSERSGDAGDLTIDTRHLLVRDGAQVGTGTRGSGKGGSLQITATDSVELIGNSASGQLSGVLSTSSLGSGDAGNLRIDTRRLLVRDGAAISTGTLGQGKGGSLQITATDSIELISTSADGQVGSVLFASSLGGSGDAGNLRIDTRRLLLRDGAGISTGTFGSGKGGNLQITATDSIELIGNSASGQVGGRLFASSEGSGDAGDLRIDTRRLLVRDGAQVSTATFGQGQGGSLQITATDSVEVIGSSADGQRGSGLFTSSFGSGDAGSLRIDAGRLLVRDGAVISSNSIREGTAGDINITVRDTLQANNGTISTTSDRSSGGNINITASNIRLFGNSDITSSVNSGAGGGGNIDLKADSIIAFDDSDILAFARDGKGGNITLDTPVFFGESYRRAPRNTDPATLDRNNRVDINATGSVEGVIITPDTSSIENSLTELPDDRINTDSLLANSCIVRRDRPTRGSFTVTGTGGLPQSPGDAQTSSFPTVDVETLPSDGTSSNSSWQTGDPIVEPQGVYRLPNGKLVMSRECP